jgi:phosphopantetheinyl transferase
MMKSVQYTLSRKVDKEVVRYFLLNRCWTCKRAQLMCLGNVSVVPLATYSVGP